MPFTEDAKEALERSLREALQLVHNYIGTEHILLSLIAADDGPGLEVLRSLGVAPVDLRDSLLAMMSMAEPSREFPLDRFSTRGRPEARTYARSESPFEARYGFSRGVRQHDRIEIAGTAPIPPDGAEVAATAYDQMLRCGEIALEALESLGGGVADVIRTVMYITDPSEADEIGRAHAELFGEAAPAATMVVVASLLDPEWKVEIEVSAQL